MTQVQQESVLRPCPRCGSPMRKPAGSTFYWHADNNHPRCTITNIVETALEAKAVDKPTEPSPKKKRAR